MNNSYKEINELEKLRKRLNNTIGVMIGIVLLIIALELTKFF